MKIKEYSKRFRVWVDEGSSKLGWIKDPQKISTTLSFYDAWVFNEVGDFAELNTKLNKQLIPHKVVKECYVEKE